MKKITKEHIEEIRQVKHRMEEAEEAAFEVCKARGYGHAQCKQYLAEAEKSAAWAFGYSVGYVRKVLKIAARREQLRSIMKEAVGFVRSGHFSKSEALRIAWAGTRKPVKLLELPELVNRILGDIAVTFDEAKSLTPVTTRKVKNGLTYKMGSGFARIAYRCISTFITSCVDISEHFNKNGDLDGFTINDMASVNPRYALSIELGQSYARERLYGYIRAWYPMDRWTEMRERLYT